MYDAFSQRPDLVIPIIGWLLLTVLILAIAGMRTWRRFQEAKMETELKLEMLANGMSADEIERVLAAKLTGRK